MANRNFKKEFSLGFQKFVVEYTDVPDADVEMELEEMDRVGVSEVENMYNLIKQTDAYKEDLKAKASYKGNSNYKPKGNSNSNYNKNPKKTYRKNNNKGVSTEAENLANQHGFGSGKQWDVLLKQGGFSYDDLRDGAIGGYSELADAVKQAFNK